mmetsp:Transcript_27249/g.64328  ORF Transcript_27249/g.64328 Transcript_27249/m.64328 type:complete len:284 (+) Transcript_27249:95-946(+)
MAPNDGGAKQSLLQPAADARVCAPLARPSLLRALVRDAVDRSADHRLVSQVAPAERRPLVPVVALDRLHRRLVQLIHQRHRGRDVELGDHILGDVVEMLDQRAERVAVRRDQQLLSLLDLRHEGVVPQRHEALDNVRERLRQRELRVAQEVVLGLLAGVEFVARLHHGRGDVIGAAPDEDLVLSMLLNCLGLVQPLEPAVHALVQTPVLDDRQMHAVHVLKDVPGSLDGALESRSVHHVELELLLHQGLGSAVRLRNARGGEGDVDPTSESILDVPLALTVAD